MARSLEFRVVAEGVEDREAYDFLRLAACHEAQGYLISRPVPPVDFEAWLRARTDSQN
jgi:EAL domain-containing protein (putative c-di-GMP-specific phosphodiesterase class I)